MSREGGNVSKKESGVVNIRGKEYRTVALRVELLRDEHPDWTVDTNVLEFAGDLILVRAEIRNEDGRIIAAGHAEEVRGRGSINQTSALENAETSAVGRALAFLGYGGSEIASADEVQRAVSQQQEATAAPRSNPVVAAKKTFARAAEARGVPRDALAMAAKMAADRVGKGIDVMQAEDWKQACSYLDEIHGQIKGAA